MEFLEAAMAPVLGSMLLPQIQHYASIEVTAGELCARETRPFYFFPGGDVGLPPLFLSRASLPVPPPIKELSQVRFKNPFRSPFDLSCLFGSHSWSMKRSVRIVSEHSSGFQARAAAAPKSHGPCVLCERHTPGGKKEIAAPFRGFSCHQEMARQHIQNK